RVWSAEGWAIDFFANRALVLSVCGAERMSADCACVGETFGTSIAETAPPTIASFFALVVREAGGRPAAAPLEGCLLATASSVFDSPVASTVRSGLTFAPRTATAGAAASDITTGADILGR